MRHRLLLVDDDLIHLESTQEFLQNRGFTVDTAKNGDEALSRVGALPYGYSLVIVDYRMQGRDGAETAEALQKINSDLFILMFSGDDSREAVLKTTRSGARGFIDKAEGAEVFLAEIFRWCKKYEETHATIDSAIPSTERAKLIESIGMVGVSQTMAEVAQTTLRLKPRKGPVLILGESGTGKELVARALHESENGPFIAVNCATFSANPQLLASQLFGHVKGAFTGAGTDKKGILEEAKGGTVFLDEIHALPQTSQMELLRVLQERKVTPVGSVRELEIHCRIIAASKPDLAEAVRTATFLPDLYFRIGRTVLTIPPLRERGDDIAPLVQHFCKEWSLENKTPRSFLQRTIPYLAAYSWPGNVRELSNVVLSLLDLCEAPKIAPDHLDTKFFPAKSASGSPSSDAVTLKARVDEAERQHLISALERSRTLREASRRLQVSLTTVLRLCKKHGIEGASYLITTQQGQL